MTKDEKYTNLLEAVIKNADSLKEASAILLKASLEKNNASNKFTFLAFAQNLLFAAIDEIGKFYLSKSFYPRNIDNIDLKKEGFESHDKKIEALVKIVRDHQRNQTIYSPDQTLSLIRRFKDNTLYVNYKNSKILMPSSSDTLKPKQFLGFINVAVSLIEMAKYDLIIFRKSL